MGTALSILIWVLWAGDWTPEPTREAPSHSNYSGTDDFMQSCGPDQKE